MSKVYLSGPITGLTYNAARFGWRKEMGDALEASGHTPLSPMRHEGHLAEVKGKLAKMYPEHLFSHPKMIVAKDLLDIDASNIVVANFLGAKKPSIGTISELGYAYAKGKTIITIMEEGCIHDHPFIRELSSSVVGKLDDAIAIVVSLLSEGV